MPEQLAQQASTLKSLGLEIDPAALSQPTSELLGSVVNLGGCTASFVSPDGLIATNHHCATGALQYNSTPQENLLRDGIREEKGTQAQQVCGHRAGLLDLLKRERPGRHHRGRMIAYHLTPPIEQGTTPPLEEGQIVSQATRGLLDIGSSLIES